MLSPKPVHSRLQSLFNMHAPQFGNAVLSLVIAHLSRFS